ncbi:MAG: nucleoside-diphosphate kinase [Elusimicrobiota bacterium]
MSHKNNLNNNEELSLVIIKPDALSKGIAGRIITQFEQIGLKIRAARMDWLNAKQAKKFYSEHKKKDFFRPLIKFMTSNPILVMVFGGEDAIERVRKLMGATDPSQAKQGTIRDRWARDGRHNVVHGSDSEESAKKEINFFFPRFKNIYKWKKKEYKI